MYKDVGHKQVSLALRRETTGKRIETIRNNW